VTTSNLVINRTSEPKNQTFETRAILSEALDQDGVVSPLRRNVQAPVNICTTKDSLHRVCDGAGKPCWSRHIVAIDRAPTNASNIHMVRLMIFATFELVITRLLYGWGDRPRQRLLLLQLGPLPNDQLDVCYQGFLLTAGANREGPYFRGLACRRSFLASS